MIGDQASALEHAVTPVCVRLLEPDKTRDQNLSRSDRSDPNEKDRLKVLNLEQFLIDRLVPSDREML
jgi:hypothetical protein